MTKIKPNEVTYKVISYCDIPEDIVPDWLEELPAGSKVNHYIYGDNDSEFNSDSLFDNWILDHYEIEVGEDILIDIDY